MAFDASALRAEIQRAFDECIVDSLEDALYRRHLEQQAANAVVVGQRTCAWCGKTFGLTQQTWTERKTHCSSACGNRGSAAVELDGRRDTLLGWARRYGVGYSTLRLRLKRGMPLKAALEKR